MKLYVTYTPSDLTEHGKSVCSKAKELGWEIVNGTEIAENRSREEELERCDALLLLSASFYSDVDVVPSREEAEWDAARVKGITTGALLVNPRGNWPLHKVQKGDTKVFALESFHSKVYEVDKDKKTGLIGYFGPEADSVCDVLPRILDAIKAEVNKRKQINIFVVWDFSVQGLDLILAAFRKKPPEGFHVKVLGLPGDGGSGEIFRDIVLEGIKESDRVLVVTDLPNANVGFEAGLALGFGKPISLVFFCASIPDWLKDSAFKGFVVNPVQDLDQLRDVVRNDNNWYTPPPPQPVPGYGKTLFLSPSCYVGSALREEQKVHYRFWRIIENNRFNLNDLQREFSNVSQVVWCIASFSQGSDNRDGAENAANALICGWFYARILGTYPRTIDTRIWVVRQKDAREVVDVKVKENIFSTIDQFSNCLKEIGKHDYRLPESEELEVIEIPSVGYKMVCVPFFENSQGEKKFWVGQYPITNRQYKEFCDNSGYPEPEYWKKQPFHPNNPVVNVSLEDVEEFCRWAELELPDQRIWEHFARAGSKEKYWWGNDDTLLPEVAWIINNSEQRLHNVGEKRASTWCLYDIFGNVWEWTNKYKISVTVPNWDGCNPPSAFVAQAASGQGHSRVSCAFRSG